MTIRFVPPQRRPDYLGTIKTALATAAAVAAKNPYSALAGLTGLIEALRGTKTATPENLAWSWWIQTITLAAAEFVISVRRNHLLDGDKDRATAAFLEAALPDEPTATFDHNALLHPSSHPAFAEARRAVLRFTLDLTGLAVLPEDCGPAYYEQEFGRCLHRASAYVFSLNFDALKPIETLVTGPAALEMQRDMAWTRHYDWITRKFRMEPVFSPEGDVETPLCELYLRLRCYWHEELSPEKEDEPPRFRAHLRDLHETAQDWLADTTDRHHLRLVAGGPGSGKSSFAKAFAAETIAAGTHRVLFVELQHMRLTGDLEADIGTYLTRRNTPSGSAGSPGLPENALDWIKGGDQPTLLIFDGLDEMSFVEARAEELTRSFIQNASRMLGRLNSDGTPVRALILGRNLAIQRGMEATALPRPLLLNVAPIRELALEDLELRSADARHMADRKAKVEVPDLEDLPKNQREDYWARWCRSQDLHAPLPEGVTHHDLNDLNVEPLLLHLFILSDYCGERWHEAAENRNRVYEDILRKIQKRNLKKPNASGAPAYTEEQFFLLMECLGLAAWRGGGRGSDEATFDKLREVHAAHRFRKGKAPLPQDLDSVVLLTHARRTDGLDPGFEFIHKSFGEYLAGRGLISEAMRLHRRFTQDEDPVPERSLVQDCAPQSPANADQRRATSSGRATSRCRTRPASHLRLWARALAMSSGRVGQPICRHRARSATSASVRS